MKQNEKQPEIKLTEKQKIGLMPIQVKFINTILEAIYKDKELFDFISIRNSGKTFTLERLDKIFNTNAEFLDLMQLKQKYKK